MPCLQHIIIFTSLVGSQFMDTADLSSFFPPFPSLSPLALHSLISFLFEKFISLVVFSIFYFALFIPNLAFSYERNHEILKLVALFCSVKVIFLNVTISG